MQCREYKSTHIPKNGHKKGKQNHICVNCSRQLISNYHTHRGYSDQMKRQCLAMYVNGSGFRQIERVKGVDHTTIITCVKEVGELFPEAYDPQTIAKVAELDQLETFVGQKNKIWLWTTVDQLKPGRLGWVLGEHSAETFCPLWNVVKIQGCYGYVIDGWSV